MFSFPTYRYSYAVRYMLYVAISKCMHNCSRLPPAYEGGSSWWQHFGNRVQNTSGWCRADGNDAHNILAEFGYFLIRRQGRSMPI
jgi:hypothetical protein